MSDNVVENVPPPSRFPFVFLTICAVSLTLSLTLYLQRHPLIRIFNACTRRISFRVGEHILVQWASEDMAVLMDDEEGDLMVNAANDHDVDVFDELIPLKPVNTTASSPFLDNYGSTRLFGIP